MCNLYSITTPQTALREFLSAVIDKSGNLRALPGVFPDTEAPVVRNGDKGRELAKARWGMPSPKFALEGKKTDPGVTNIRNTSSAHWKRWLGPAHRCLVPFTSFSEYDTIDGRKAPVWFALGEDRPLACFAGIWTEWTSVRKLKEGEVTVDAYGFLTCPPNAEVGKVHPKAMPVILTEPDEFDRWLNAEWKEASKLQRPLPDGTLMIVAQGEKKDGAER